MFCRNCALTCMVRVGSVVSELLIIGCTTPFLVKTNLHGANLATTPYFYCLLLKLRSSRVSPSTPPNSFAFISRLGICVLSILFSNNVSLWLLKVSHTWEHQRFCPFSSSTVFLLLSKSLPRGSDHLDPNGGESSKDGC